MGVLVGGTHELCRMRDRDSSPSRLYPENTEILPLPELRRAALRRLFIFTFLGSGGKTIHVALLYVTMRKDLLNNHTVCRETERESDFTSYWWLP